MIAPVGELQEVSLDRRTAVISNAAKMDLTFMIVTHPCYLVYAVLVNIHCLGHMESA